jgi:hypothetical protein
MTKPSVLPRALLLVLLTLVSLQLEECSKKPKTKDESTTTIPDSLKRYPFRSAVIELKYGGSASGKQAIYIDDFGQKETTVDSLTMKMMGMEMPSFKVSIRNRDTVYQVDFVRQLATKAIDHTTAADEQAMNATGEQMAKGMGMKKAEKEEMVAGQKCIVWSSEALGTKTWVWNNITLKSESTVGDDTILLDPVAVSVNVPVPQDRFVPPQGIHYTTEEEMQSMLDNADKNLKEENREKKKTK